MGSATTAAIDVGCHAGNKVKEVCLSGCVVLEFVLVVAMVELRTEVICTPKLNEKHKTYKLCHINNCKTQIHVGIYQLKSKTFVAAIYFRTIKTPLIF